MTDSESTPFSSSSRPGSSGPEPTWEESAIPRWQAVLRWIALAPGAFLAGFVAGIVVIVSVRWLFGSDYSGWWTQAIHGCVLGMTQAFGTLKCAEWIAPSRKVGTVFVSAMVLVFIAVVGTLTGTLDYWPWFELASLAGVTLMSVAIAVKSWRGRTIE